MTTPDPAPPAAGRSSRAMLIAFLVVSIDLLGFGIVLPLVPRYAEKFLTIPAIDSAVEAVHAAQGKPVPPTPRYSELATGAIIGALYSSFSLMQFVFSPVWGRVSDRVGRKPILLMSLLGSVVFYALFGFASTLPAADYVLALSLLMLSRIGAGIAGASVSTASAVIADSTPPEKRAKGMALIGAAFGIGFTFGPLIAWAGDEAFAGREWGPGAVASGLSFVAFLAALLIFKETLHPGPKPPREFFSVRRTLDVLRMPTVGPLVLVYFLTIFGFANFEGTVSLFTKDAFGFGNRDNYLVFAYVGFVLMVAQGAIYRPLATRRPEDFWVKLGVGLMLAGLGGLAAVAYGSYMMRASGTGAGLDRLFYLSVTVAVTGFAFVNPSVTALVSKKADPTRQGEVLGVNQAFASLGRILGPFVGSTVYFWHESRVLPYAVAAVLVGGVAVLLPQVNAGPAEPQS